MKLNTFSLTLGHIRWSLGNQKNMDRFFCPMSINFIEKPPDLGITKVVECVPTPQAIQYSGYDYSQVPIYKEPFEAAA